MRANILSIVTEPVPRVPDSERISVDDLGLGADGIFHVSTRYGYMATPNVPAALHPVDQTQTEGPIVIDDASYFLSRVELEKRSESTMRPWRKRLSLPRRASPPTPPNNSACRPTGRSSWDHASRCDPTATPIGAVTPRRA